LIIDNIKTIENSINDNSTNEDNQQVIYNYDEAVYLMLINMILDEDD